MASLPSNTFMFNYNAREYVAATRTFPKTQGQLFDEDLVLNTTPNSVYEDYVNFGRSSAYMLKSYGTNSANPFNRNSSNNSFTFIYKTSGFTSSNTNLFANRGSSHNYMVRGSMFHTRESGFLNMEPNTYPEICLIRIYADGTSERKFLASDGTVLQSVSRASISWGNASNAVGFFSGYGNQGAELFQGIFYWMYCSLETLTDAEVLQVIKYNEPSSFDVDTTAITATFSATSSSVTLDAEDDVDWTASTSSSWITVSPVSGTGSATITISLAKNTAYVPRTGTVEITNGEDTIEITVEQEKYPLLVPKNNIYREGNLIN